MSNDSAATPKRKPGRPRNHYNVVKRLTIYFDAAMLQRAVALGEGSIQGGVRRALLGSEVSANLDAKADKLPHAPAAATGETPLD